MAVSREKRMPTICCAPIPEVQMMVSLARDAFCSTPRLQLQMIEHIRMPQSSMRCACIPAGSVSALCPASPAARIIR